MFKSQLVSGAIQEVTVEYTGAILDYNVAPVPISLLKGLLTPILNETVNYINAPVVAKERGIKVVESKSSEIGDFTNLINLTVKTSQEVSSAAASLFGRKDYRIVRINKFTMEVIPAGHMLGLYNSDKPA